MAAGVISQCQGSRPISDVLEPSQFSIPSGHRRIYECRLHQMSPKVSRCVRCTAGAGRTQYSVKFPQHWSYPRGDMVRPVYTSTAYPYAVRSALCPPPESCKVRQRTLTHRPTVVIHLQTCLTSSPSQRQSPHALQCQRQHQTTLSCFWIGGRTTPSAASRRTKAANSARIAHHGTSHPWCEADLSRP